MKTSTEIRKILSAIGFFLGTTVLVILNSPFAFFNRDDILPKFNRVESDKYVQGLILTLLYSAVVAFVIIIA